MLKKFARLFRDEEGISAIEYAVIGAAVLGVITAGAALLTPRITTGFQSMADQLPQ
ncbi:MAG: Flp/Fap pilin component [Desulfovibrionales bacterium]|jgi:Flp pilus assembly pilin Flp|nr:Flp/Fap pilin component [Desulfovibrionales bacterium]